eukprot:scaffold70387_cov52-Attheya_sp.AAC.2
MRVLPSQDPRDKLRGAQHNDNTSTITLLVHIVMLKDTKDLGLPPWPIYYFMCDEDDYTFLIRPSL